MEFADGSTRGASLVIGCDGLHSVIPQQLVGDDVRNAGNNVWRGVCDLSPDEIGACIGELWGRGRRFGYVGISATSTYWFATEEVDGGLDDPEEVSPERRKRHLMETYDGWTAPVGRLIEATPAEALIFTPCLDRKPTHTWGDGRVTLLGDAAHPMTPNLGQGACQAIEDAYVLAETLAGQSDTPVEALRQYEARRKEHTTWFVE